MLSHPAHWIALGGGSGLSPYAPGTVGTLLAIPLHAILNLWLAAGVELALAGGLFLVGCWACAKTSADLGVVDHGGINIDEIAAFLAVLAIAPQGWLWQAVAFGLFRFFDIVKPPPIRFFERSIPGGFGVMFDDLLAAGYTLLILVIAYRVLA
ncbi:MAG: phosphatidylglycerophosphatase A [Betaproteobacteria bacterium]|nr:phosphatidylglycerophosphatase A [Betaproteobacteria bacterium]